MKTLYIAKIARGVAATSLFVSGAYFVADAFANTINRGNEIRSLRYKLEDVKTDSNKISSGDIDRYDLDRTKGRDMKRYDYTNTDKIVESIQTARQLEGEIETLESKMGSDNAETALGMLLIATGFFTMPSLKRQKEIRELIKQK